MKSRRRSVYRVLLRWGMAALSCMLTGPIHGWAHELSQPVPVLLERMHDSLLLINRGKPDQAYAKALGIQADFPDTSRGRLIQEIGVHRTAQRLDAAYGTRLSDEVDRALDRKDIPLLQKVLYSLSFLLILEKLDRLDVLMRDPEVRLDTKAAVLAVAHDYFSHMFERLLRFRAPERIRALDQLLERMAVVVKRGDAAALRERRAAFLTGLYEGFQEQLVGGQLRPVLVAEKGSGT